MKSQRRIDKLQIDTLVEVKTTGGYDGLICHCVEQNSIYRYVASGLAFTANDRSILITGDGGDTRWVSGNLYNFKKESQILSIVGGEVDLDALNGLFGKLVLTSDTRINTPSNMTAGDKAYFSIIEDGSGPYGLEWGSLGLDVTAVSGVINNLGATAVIILPLATDLSNVSVGDFLEISGSTNNINNQNGYRITAVDTGTGAITYEARNGSNTELGTYDLKVSDGKTIWTEGIKWHSSIYRTVFEIVFDGELYLISRVNVLPDRNQRSSIKNESEWHDDFFGTSVEGSMFDWTATNGNNGAIAAIGTIADENHPGTWRFRLTVDAGSRHTLRTEDNAFALDGMKYEFEAMLHQRTLVSALNDCYYQVGLGNDANAGQHTFGAYFFYDLSSPNWQCRTANGGTRTIYDTGVPVIEDQWTRLGIESQDGASEAVFKINGVVVATLTTNLPGTELLGVMLKGEEQGGGSSVSMDTIYDYCSWKYQLIGDRDEY